MLVFLTFIQRRHLFFMLINFSNKQPLAQVDELFTLSIVIYKGSLSCMSLCNTLFDSGKVTLQRLLCYEVFYKKFTHLIAPRTQVLINSLSDIRITLRRHQLVIDEVNILFNQLALAMLLMSELINGKDDTPLFHADLTSRQ